uniref:Short coiled-coil protein n=1 Tax=Sinocyclocheilus rhinocerous TaxID=307959 RepID=A0A673IFI2_9TELE
VLNALMSDISNFCLQVKWALLLLVLNLLLLKSRVDAVKEENLKLKSENQVLGQYIENLMSASSVFQTTDSKSKRK